MVWVMGQRLLGIGGGDVESIGVDVGWWRYWFVVGSTGCWVLMILVLVLQVLGVVDVGSLVLV